MPKIPFSPGLRPVVSIKRYDVERRLENFLRGTRKRIAERDGRPRSGVRDEFDAFSEGSDHDGVTHADSLKITRRAKRYVELKAGTRQMFSIPEEDHKRFDNVRSGVRLIGLRSKHQADEIAATLHEEMPWMQAANEAVWLTLRSHTPGEQGVTLPPLLLVGQPGLGKSVWARRLAELLKVPLSVVEGTSEGTGFSVAGVQRGFSTAGPGKPLNSILKTGIGNPVVVVDELDKAIRVMTRDGSINSVQETLLPLLAMSSSKAWECPYFQIPFDMSHISWIMTANSLDPILSPLLSRVTTIKVPPLSPEHIMNFLHREGQKLGLSDAAQDAVEEAVDQHIDHHERIDLRILTRMLQRAQQMEVVQQHRAMMN